MPISRRMLRARWTCGRKTSAGRRVVLARDGGKGGRSVKSREGVVGMRKMGEAARSKDEAQRKLER